MSEANFQSALQASCSIPFMLRAVHDMPGAPAGAYWDGGITDYHLHLNDTSAPMQVTPSAPARSPAVSPGAETCPLVLVPHIQGAVVPGWPNERLRWRHKPTHLLDNLLLLAPDPKWARSLRNGNDFLHYRHDLARGVKAWRTAASASGPLADEFAPWLHVPEMCQIDPL